MDKVVMTLIGNDSRTITPKNLILIRNYIYRILLRTSRSNDQLSLRVILHLVLATVPMGQHIKLSSKCLVADSVCPLY